MQITKDCLIEALQGEENAIIRYAEFATLAEKEGFANVAYLFKALVETEVIHKKNHLQALGDDMPQTIKEEWPLGSTQENVIHAITGETSEYKHGYPIMIKKIRKEGHSIYHKVAELSMRWSANAEKTHAQVLALALKAIKAGRDLDADKIYICKVCGNLILDKKQIKEVCPVCGHDPLFYELIKRNA